MPPRWITPVALAILAIYSGLSPAAAQKPETLAVHVVAVYPHDPKAFTQGLLFHEGFLYESTGIYGVSDIRKVEPATGRVVMMRPLPEEYFGEGLARRGRTLVQLTWFEQSAFVYDLDTFELLDRHTYEGQGWGLCYGDGIFYRSDGSNRLYLHEPEEFGLLGTLAVTLDGRPAEYLNELECVGDEIYANRFGTDEILRIDRHSGTVTGLIDARGLLSPEERSRLSREAVLNGIAYDPAEDLFYLSGKKWPVLFKVLFHTP